MNADSCRKCGVELNDNNWYPSCKKTCSKICNKCEDIRHKEWTDKNKEKYNELCRRSRKKQYLKNKEKILERNKEWQKNNPKKRKVICARYRQNNKEEITKRCIVYNSKKHRNFGYNPLNKYFEGSEGHHINKTDVIFIPSYIHIGTSHKQKKPATMVAINYIAFFFLVQQNIKKISKLFKEG